MCNCLIKIHCKTWNNQKVIIGKNRKIIKKGRLNKMKKYISIFELFARSTIYKIVVILLATGAFQVIRFQQVMQEWIPLSLYELDFQAIEHHSLEWMIEHSNSAVFMAAAFVCITGLLCLSGCDIGSKCSYTLQRLQVTEKTVFIIQSLYNMACYILLLGAQTAVFLIQSKMYTEQAGIVTNQTVFLAFYRSDFMHSVLPLEDTMRLVCNIFLIAGCGISAAVSAYLQRRGKLAWSLLVVLACIILGFVRTLGNTVILLVAFLVLIIAGVTAYYHVWYAPNKG